LGPLNAALYGEGSWQGDPRSRQASRAGRSGVDPLQRAWHNQLAPVRVSMRPTSLVQTSEHLLARGCRQCRRSPAVNETFLQEICRNLTNRT
jgi:hypothetical protein